VANIVHRKRSEKVRQVAQSSSISSSKSAQSPRVLILTPLDIRSASFRLRLGFFLDHLVAGGRIAEYRVNDLSCYPSSDILIIQRYVPFTRDLAELLIRDPKPIVYETDDLLHQVPFHHGQYTRSLRGVVAAYLGFLRAWDAAIVTSTPYLARKLAQYDADVSVIANAPPVTIPPIPPEIAKPLLVSFVGTPTHARDFAAIGDALPRLAARYGKKLRFLFMGYEPHEMLAQGLPIDYRPFTDDYLLSLERFRQCKPAIGLAPLLDNVFNRAKSAIKFIDYTYAGAVGIYSNVVPYRGIRGGLLAGNHPDEWYAGLCRLVEDERFRKELLAEAIQEVATRFSFAVQASHFGDILECVAARQPRLSSKVRTQRITDAAREARGSGHEVEFLEYVRIFYPLCLRGRIPVGEVLGTIAKIDTEDPFVVSLTLKAVEAVIGAEGLATIQGPLRKTFLTAPYAQVGHLAYEMYRLASTAQSRGVFNEAVPIFERILRDSHETELRAGAAFHLGEMALAGKDRLRAQALFRQCVELNPEHRKGKERLLELGSQGVLAMPRVNRAKR
jgi:hypothetical protein